MRTGEPRLCYHIARHLSPRDHNPGHGHTCRPCLDIDDTHNDPLGPGISLEVGTGSRLLQPGCPSFAAARPRPTPAGESGSSCQARANHHVPADARQHTGRSRRRRCPFRSLLTHRELGRPRTPAFPVHCPPRISQRSSARCLPELSATALAATPTVGAAR